jgi:hypothetical protein
VISVAVVSVSQPEHKAFSHQQRVQHVSSDCYRHQSRELSSAILDIDPADVDHRLS